MNNVMNDEVINDGVRPRMIILTVLAIAVILVGMFLLSPNKPAPKENIPLPVPTAEPARPMAVVKSPTAVAPAPAAPAAPTAVEKDWGVRVVKLALARQGSAIDLQYQIASAEKAGLVGSGTNTAYLIDTATGTEYQLTSAPQDQVVSGTVRARSRALALRLAGEFPPPAGRIVPGKTYSALLPNPSGTVKSGSVMSLVIGTSRVDNLIVE